MSLSAGKILKISITSDTKKKILEEIQKYLGNTSKSISRNVQRVSKPFIIFTPNPEQIVYAQSHQWFATILNQADVALPDGIGLVWASQFLGRRPDMDNHALIQERIPGVEFMEDLIGYAANWGDTIGLIGGFDGLAVKAYERLRSKYTKLVGWGEDGPHISYFPHGITMDKAAILHTADRIQRTKASLIFVGLGAPKQEAYINELIREMEKRDYHKPLVLMAVGGSFEIIADRLKRAPVFIRSIGFEWAWRLLQEPWRWKRQLALITFVVLLIREKVGI